MENQGEDGNNLRNETPPIVSSIFDNLLFYLSAYGWHVLFAFVVANLIWTSVKPKIRKWQEKQEDRRQQEDYHQNPERIMAMQEGMERSRRNLQDQHDRLAADRAEKLQQAQEEKQREKIQKWEHVQKGSSSGMSRRCHKEQEQPSTRPPKTENRMRGNDYNPLMGSSGGGGFRGSRHTFGGSGGG